MKKWPFEPLVFSAKTPQEMCDADGKRFKNSYTTESVGISCGFLLSALHHAGLATLTHTPSPMKFLNTLLERPKQERAFMIIVAGYPEVDASVPVIGKLALEEIAPFEDCPQHTGMAIWS